VHRDLKPSNIIIDNDGNPHLLDFGLARYTKQGDPSGEEEMTMTGQFVGTMPWASPEQVRGNASIIDIRSDVYTLGLVLYRMLTGQYPYGVKGDVPDVLRNITEAPPMPMNDAYALSKPESQRSWLTSWLPHRPEIDPVLEAIVFKALTKDAEYRYLSAGDLARDLHSYLEGTPTVAAGFAERLGLIRVLKVAVVTAAVAGLFALISLAIASGWFDERVRPPKPANIQSISGTSDRVNVLHLVNLKRHRLSGGWHREGGGIRGEAEPRGRSELVLPVVLQNRYQVEVTFVRFEGEGGVSVFLPLGNGRSVTLTIGAADGKHAGLSRVDNRNAEDRNNPTSMPIEITTRVPHTVRIAVTPKQGDDVHIAGTLDDETIVNWTGPVTQLRTEYIRYKARDSWRDTLGLIVMPNTSVHFSKVHVEQY